MLNITRQEYLAAISWGVGKITSLGEMLLLAAVFRGGADATGNWFLGFFADLLLFAIAMFNLVLTFELAEKVPKSWPLWFFVPAVFVVQGAFAYYIAHGSAEATRALLQTAFAKG